MTNPPTDPEGRAPQPGVRAKVLGGPTNGLYRVRRIDGRELVAHAAQHLRMAFTRLVPGDAVLIEPSPFDPDKARILRILKSSEPSQHDSPPSPPQQREQS